MNKKCVNCKLINFNGEELCRRCGGQLRSKETLATSPGFAPVEDNPGEKLNLAVLWFLKRFASALLITAIIICGAYFSMLQSADKLDSEQQAKVNRSVEILRAKGFATEVFLLRNTVAFRASDNWFNALTGHKDAYASTNFPVQIVTLYESFFAVPVDDAERAMILLHEARHLQGAGEPEAYEFVWRNRKKLGWTSDRYGQTKVWRNVSDATKQHAPKLFSCEFNPNADCTE